MAPSRHRPILLLRPRLAAGALLVLGGWAQAKAGDGILLLKSRDLPQYTAAANGFLAKWQETSGGRPVSEQILSGPGASTRARPDAPPPRVVVAIGTEAVTWALQHTTGPVVFCMVANARQHVLAGLGRAQAARMTGVSLDIPVKTQWEQLCQFLPRVRRIGLLYDPAKSAVTAHEAAQAAADLGLHLTLEAVPDEAALPAAVKRLAANIDLLWAPVDSTVFNSRSAQFVLTEMLQQKVPVMGFSENMVRAGALLALRLNYPAIGRQTAELLQAVLSGRAVEGGPAQPPRRFQMVVNARVLKLLGNPIPPPALRLVSLVNDED